MPPRTRRIDRLSWSEVAKALEDTDLAIVPVSALEPHGHHAPLGTDTFIASEIAERLAEAANGLVFPGVHLGAMNVVYEFRDLPGTISIDPRLLVELYTAIGVALGRSGFKRLVLVNGHAGNTPVLGIVAYQILEKARVRSACWSGGRRPRPRSARSRASRSRRTRTRSRRRS